MVKGFVNYTYDTGVGTGYGGGASVKHMRFEDVHFVSNTVDYAIWFQLAPRYWTGRGYPEGRGIAKAYSERRCAVCQLHVRKRWRAYLDRRRGFALDELCF